VTGQLDRVRAAVRAFANKSAAGAPAGSVGMMRITIRDDSTENAKGLDRMFDAMGATIDDLPDIMLAAVPTIRQAHAAVFKSEGSEGRGAWEGLAERTRLERAALGYNPSSPILKRTGALEQHVLNTPAEVTRTGDSIELRIEPDVEVDGVPKYRALAKGYEANNLPGRPMVALGPTWAKRVTSTVQRAFRDRAQANGLR
jgi:hypothetical protein